MIDKDSQVPTGDAFKELHKLINTAVYIAGLAEVLHKLLDEACHAQGIKDAQNLAWSFNAMGQMANDLAEKIGEYAP